MAQATAHYVTADGKIRELQATIPEGFDVCVLVRRGQEKHHMHNGVLRLRDHLFMKKWPFDDVPAAPEKPQETKQPTIIGKLTGAFRK
jgi:hypothetical protein